MLSIALPACDAVDEPSAPESDEIVAADASPIVAEVALGDGQFVRFIDERVDGMGEGVGVMIVGEPRLVGELSRAGGTPLELFLALAPERDAPDVMWDDHERLAEAAGGDSLPRELGGFDLVDALRPSRGQIKGPFDCSTWFEHFCDDLASGSTWCNQTYGIGNTINNAGAASQRWLGACNDSSVPALNWKVEAQVSASVWTLVTGTTTTVSTNNAVIYSSSGFLFQDYRSIINTTATQAYYVGMAH